MKTIAVVGLVLATSGFLLFASLSKGIATDTGQLEIFYGAFIDDLISRCESKRAMCNSKCESIRRSVSLYSLKASFYEYHKEELIRDMIEEQVGTKPYQIYYYLNERFFHTFRDAIKCVDSRAQ